jgi:hypothetical protein
MTDGFTEKTDALWILMLAEVADDLSVGPGERFEIVFYVRIRTYEITARGSRPLGL